MVIKSLLVVDPLTLGRDHGGRVAGSGLGGDGAEMTSYMC